MEVKIGVQNASRELVLDSSESPADVEKAVSAALADDGGVLTLTDSKGRTVLVPLLDHRHRRLPVLAGPGDLGPWSARSSSS